MGNLLSEAAKYAAASAVALVADTGLLLALTRYAGWDYRYAAAVSFMVGATIAYALSVSFVFSAHRLRSREPGIRQFHSHRSGGSDRQHAGAVRRAWETGH